MAKKINSTAANQIHLTCGCQSFFSKRLIAEVFDDFKIKGSPLYDDSYTLGKITDVETQLDTTRTFTVCIVYSDLFDLLKKTTTLAQYFEYYQMRYHGDFYAFWIKAITSNS